jgi:hypothetical protein
MEPIGLSLALGCLFEGLRTLRSDQPLKQKMELLEKTKNFDLDYLPNLDGVPREKPICLRGYLDSFPLSDKAFQSPDTNNGASPSKVDPSEELAVGKVIWQPPQAVSKKPAVAEASGDPEFEDTALIGESEGTNYIADVGACPANRAMYLTNDKGELILLTWKDSLLLHNTALVFAPGNEQSLTQIYSPSLLTDLSAWFAWNVRRRFLSDKGRVVELGLKKGESYNFIGSIYSYNGQFPNPRGAKLMMNSSIVTGEMKELIMRTIDNHIHHGINKARICLFGCFAISSAVLVYRKLIRPAKIEESLQRAQRSAKK